MDEKQGYKEKWEIEQELKETEDALAECRERALDWSMAHDAALARAEAAEAALAECKKASAASVIRQNVLSLRNAIARAEAAEAALAEREAPCVWAPCLGDGYSTGCGAWYQANQIDAGLFCPNCGHRIEVREPAP